MGPVINEEGNEVLGEADLLLRDKDPSIYNDHDFYKNLLSDFLNASGIMSDALETTPLAGHNHPHLPASSHGDFLFGADLSLTQKFLAKK